MNIKAILNHLFGKVMKDGKRIPDTRIMVFGTRIFFEDYLLPDDTIVCTDWADFISMRMRGKYNHVEFLSESEIKKMVSEEKLYNYMERKYDMKKFDLIVMNPPYAGRGDPLFMKISKVIYENFLSDTGRLVSINPTSVVDNTYDGLDSHSNSLKKNYVDNMNVESFEYSPEMRTSFDADIGTEICVITYSKNGKHTLHDDYVRGKRFGEKNWKMRKSIIGKVNEYIAKNGSIYKMNGYLNVNDANENNRKLIISKNVCSNGFVSIFGYNRGHVSEVGGRKWDWTTLQSEGYLRLANKHTSELRNYGIESANKVDGVNLNKWSCTDIMGFVVGAYKTQMANNEVLFKMLPCPPPTNGDYSDETLMRIFGFTEEEMDWIHIEMKDFGWKVNLKKTESELMEYIDEINR